MLEISNFNFHPFHLQNVESDVKITAGLSFHLRKRVPQRELETNVVYAAMSTK